MAIGGHARDLDGVCACGRINVEHVRIERIDVDRINVECRCPERAGVQRIGSERTRVRRRWCGGNRTETCRDSHGIRF